MVLLFISEQENLANMNLTVKSAKYFYHKETLYFLMQNVSDGYLLSNVGCASAYLICT